MVTSLWQWLNRNKHVAHLVAFLMIVIPAAFIYSLAQQEAVTWIWVLLVIIIIGNILVVSLD